MIPKYLSPLLCAVVLVSCGKRDLVEDEPPIGSLNPPVRPTGPTPPRPIIGVIPFDVPNVTENLPSERDLKSRQPAAPSFPVNPQEPKERTAPVTPPAEEPSPGP